MKATKLGLIVALIAFAMMGYSQVEKAPDPGKFAVKMSLQKAMNSKALVKAMYEQLDQKAILQGEPAGYITVKVRFGRAIYYIYGTYGEWRNFFVIDNMFIREKKINR